MIYLIKTNYGVMSLLKIGYTNNIENRLKDYRTHNPLVELISSREGSPELENFLHKYFSEYSYSNQPEWFYYNDYIIDNFLKVESGDYISKKRLMSILNYRLKLGKKRNTKDLKNKYIEKYGNEDYQLRKHHLYRFWNDLNESLSEYTLEGNCPDKISINSTITIKNLPFGLDSVSLDLLQILGRQKLNSNCQNNVIEFCYKTLSSRKMITKKEFEKYQEEKLASSEILLSLWEKADGGIRKDYLQKLRSSIEVDNNRYDFISIDTKTGTPVFNKLIQIADQRAWDVCQKDYQDSIINEEIKEHLNSDLENPIMEQYLFYGTKECKAREFRDNELKKGWKDKNVFLT